MKLSRILFIPSLILAAAAFFGCQDKDDSASTAILVDETSILVPASENDRTITIFADGSWEADVTETWLTVSPNCGNGTVDVTIHSSYNSAEASRDAKLLIKGSDIVKFVTVEITQKGDRFKNAAEYSVSELAALEEGTLVRVKESTVMAISKAGFVVSDGESNFYVSGHDGNLKIGDRVILTGEIAPAFGIPALLLEDPTIVSSGEASYPEPADISGITLTTIPKTVEYVTFDGTYSSGHFTVNEQDSFVPASPLDSFNLSDLDLHYVAVNGYFVGIEDKNAAFVLTSVEDKGPMGTVYLGFEIETSSFKAANPDYGTTATFVANEGDGYIKYVPYDLANTDANKKHVMDISGNDPRCTGPWPGDYWLFYGEKPIKSGSKVQIKFGARTSATGHKYWIIEYLDGKTWKCAGTPLVSTDMPEGQNVTYTHAMNADGATNVTVNETFVLTRNVEHGQFRFRCVSNWQASGAGPLETRNGGSARLAVSSAGNVAPQPTVIILEEGDGSAVDPVPANITISEDHLAFDGTPSGPKTFTVSSDQDYTVSSTVSWLHLDVTEGTAGEEQTITVTCDPSELSILREGAVTVLSGETEASVPVVQGALGQKLDPFISVSTGNKMEVGSAESSISVRIQSNVAFSQSVDCDWITVEPAVGTRAAVEWTDFTFKVAANEVESPRTGHITFADEDNNLETVVTVNQAAFVPLASGEIFKDDFEWMRPYIDAYNATVASSKAIGKSVEENNASGVAPNLYTTAALASLAENLLAKGYEDINPSIKSVYPQDCYWKFGKTSSHTGIKLPALDYEGDATISFDWSPHMTGSGSIDKTNIVVEVVGSGKVVTSSGLAEVSDPAVNDWTDGRLEWKKVSFSLKGLSKTDRIIIRPQFMEDHDGVTQMRWYIDNILVKEPEPALHAEWAFSADLMSQYKDTFGGTDGFVSKDAGDAGLYVPSNAESVGTGKIKYCQTDKSSFTDSSPKRTIGATGQPYVTGAWPGDYWLFEATDAKEYAAGTKVRIYFTTRLSASGQKYWLLEAWDGEKWIPVYETSTVAVEGQGDVTYNFTPATATPDTVVDYTWTLAKSCTVMQFRYKCVANSQANGKGPLAAPNGGTCRIAGAAASGSTSSTSPVFEVVM